MNSDRCPVAAIANALQHGPGWCVGRWLDDQFESDELAVADVQKFSRKLGVAVAQDENGELVGLVRNEGLILNGPTARGYRTPVELPLHNDRADVVVLHCVRQAARGGELGILEFAPLLAALKSSAPALLEKLMQPFPFDLRRPPCSQDRGWAALPVITDLPEFQGIWYCNLFIRNAARFGGDSALTEEQNTTLNEFENFIQNMGLVRRFILRPGETLVMNSHKTLHSRNSFVDNPHLGAARFLVRVWLAPLWSKRLPSYYEPLFHAIEPGQPRGGFGSPP
jgi:Taurine catabolism dioxygenase TauD, TfdA family